MTQIKTINTLSYVKSQPQRFLRYENVTAHELASNIVSDALSLGAYPISVERYNETWLIHSPIDWLSMSNTLSPEDTFKKLIPNPLAGQNASRHEVLLAAFADVVAVYKNNELFEIRNILPDKKLLINYINKKYADHTVVAFSLIEK